MPRWHEPTERADDVLAEWARRNPDTHRATLTDAGLHAQQQILRTVLVKADRALADEGIVPRVRRRVLNRIVFGAPDPDEVISADEIRRKAEDILRTNPNLDGLRAATIPGEV